MLTQRTKIKLIAVGCSCLCAILVLSALVIAEVLKPRDSELQDVLLEDAERFKSYELVLPDVTYEEIERFLWPESGGGRIPAPGFEEEGGESPSIPSVSLPSAVKIHDSYSPLSKELNLYLYGLATTYCGNMYVGDIKLSPMLPLAEANLEGGRVDTSVTFSAIASSSIFSFDSVEELESLNVTDCLKDAATWRAMSSEYYTRDRGALQCNPNYGADKPEYGPSERELLDAYVAEHGMPNYGTNHDSIGNVFTVEDWIEYSRTKSGDRFNPESIIRIFADEKRNVEIPGILRNFPDVENEWQVYCIMAYNHWCGSGYMTMDRSIAYAGWQTVAKSDEYIKDITTPEAIEVLYSQCVQDIQRARAAGRNPVRCLDSYSGRALFDRLHEAGIVKDYYYYFRDKTNAGGTWNQGRTACTYPLGLMYGIMQMNLLYAGY